MHNKSVRNRGYVLAILLGAIGGGLVVALATKAIPKMMSRMMEDASPPQVGLTARLLGSLGGVH